MSGLNFQDFNVNVGDIGTSNSPFTNSISQQTKSFSSFENSKVGGTMGDTTETSTSDAKKPNFLSFNFYQRFFDVDTNQVQTRILQSFLPTKNSNFIMDHIQPIPDLYGPFWICVTLIFSIAIFGNFTHYIQNTGVSSTYENDFGLVTSATSLIICYVILVPFFIYSFMWKRKSVVQYSYMEIVCTYGYSLAIFIPVSVFWVVQIQWFRWFLIIISVISSGIVLVNSFWPVVKDDLNRVVSLSFIAGIMILHTLLAVAFKQFYFDASMPSGYGANFKNNTHLVPSAAALNNNTMVGEINAVKFEEPSALNQVKNDDAKNLELNNVVDDVNKQTKSKNVKFNNLKNNTTGTMLISVKNTIALVSNQTKIEEANKKNNAAKRISDLKDQKI